MQAAARAHANIALIKYWGKRDGPGNLPATGSISVTLDALFTDTSVAFLPHLSKDEICLESGGDTRRVSRFVDLVRRRAGMTMAARVHSRNSFPTSAGLASSASAFAALALAACHAAGLSLSVAELSALARQGSGSAARSLFGGYVEMRRGGTANGQDAHAVSLCAPAHWPLAMVIAITSTDTKTTGSSKGMARTAATSPYYPAWLDGAAA
ncbi:MAG: diphosphomevalonate decarboxylase, partial [Salinisphaera sp.]|nr:diphosphomevalonate decarboxylase [Salinisphaera sp.]